jgi:hypothetical protein
MKRWMLIVAAAGAVGAAIAPAVPGAVDEDSWVRFAGTIRTRPPMPWFNLREMREDDLRAMYRYVRSLPGSDRPVPAYVPPGRPPTTPHIVMTPRPPQR